MKKTISNILLCLLSCAAFAAANPSKVQAGTSINKKTGLPMWVSNPYTDYNERLYLAGVGSGSDDNSAEDDAKSDLIKTLNQKITAIENVKTYADSKTENSIYTQDIDTTTTITGIAGLQVVEKFHASDNKVYALAVLNRQQASDNYQRQIQQNNKAITEYITFAKQEPGTIQSCVYGHKAITLAQENEYYTELIKLIGAPYGADTSLSYGSFVQLSQTVSEIKSLVQVKIAVTGDSQDLAKAAFEKAFAKIGILTSARNDSPYILTCNIKIEKTENPDTNHSYHNFSYTAELMSIKTKDVLLSHSNYGRAGHLNDQGSKNRAMLSIVKDIDSKFYEKLEQYTQTGELK